ncbi:MAG: universal stress protein [Bacteroidetes bacterium]|nr:universal stress protein [Bacteroidota bacterium]MBS1632318.1 universal stress protein [Bacteroidota bacterium]
MKKVLVPTDFSAHSKSGMRFAIHWANRQQVELVFIHVLHILRPTRWSDAYFAAYAEKEENACLVKFKKFIDSIYRNMKVRPGKYSLVIKQGISADISILDYCRTNPDIDFICISTRGAGKFKRIFGTNTGNLISKSKVPVLAVPKNYRSTGIKSIMYATDFKNYSQEIKKVVDFALPFKATVDVLHFTWPDEPISNKKVIEASFKAQYKYDINLHFRENDAVHTLIENLQTQVRIRKPSVVIMFTKQERTFFQKLFLSSKTEEFSFQLKVPLLVFNKY